MQFKVLKHKTQPDKFGQLFVDLIGRNSEIEISTIPQLFPNELTIDIMLNFYKYIQLVQVVNQLQDYDLVTVYVSKPLPPFLIGEEGNELMDKLRSLENLEAWKNLAQFLHNI